eukprot:gene15130-20368_t
MSSKIVDEVTSANSNYASKFGDLSKLALPPARRFAILTCMDARLDPAKYAGLSEGDAHVIRNAGGRASDDAIRSLEPKSGSLFIILIVECNSLLDQIIAELLEHDLVTASIDENGWHPTTTEQNGSTEGKYIKWQTFSNLEVSVIEDVKRVRSHPLVPHDIPIYGYYFDVKTGLLVPVPEAIEAGQAIVSKSNQDYK